MRLCAIDDADPDLLVDLLGERAFPDAAGDEAKEGTPVAPVERVEGTGIAVAISEHQFFVPSLHAA